MYRTPSGVIQEMDGARGVFRGAFNQYVLASGLLSDELTAADNPVDLRKLTEGATAGDATGAYAPLQNARVQANLVAHAIGAYAPTMPAAIRGEAYALQAYAELMLADLFCSGVPLTTLKLRGGIQYEAGSPRDSIYEHAVEIFDSAIALTTDSVRLATLARVGKGRALLALGRFDAAAHAVASVQDTDAYRLFVVVGPANDANGIVETADFKGYSESDREGGVGQPFRSSGDPRTPFTQGVVVIGGGTTYAPTKYNQPGQTSGDSALVTIADGIEARLIEAEAALRRGTSADISLWLSTLNHLRATAPLPTPDPTGPPLPLDSLVDPGNTVERQNMMFAERAAWLYLTGHRQGDLRRLIRQYGRTGSQIYPSGRSVFGDTYGTAVTAPIPSEERVNPLFAGCLDFGA